MIYVAKNHFAYCCACCVLLYAAGCASRLQVATKREVIASKCDLWGEAALRQPGGPNYSFFKSLLPPLRYVDADFRQYPIVLSAPAAVMKGRLVSDGSQINALARQPNWINEAGVPVHVLVGAQREAFGRDACRLDGPRYAEDDLPIVALRYSQDAQIYGEEVFASVEPALAAFGTVVARFDFPAAQTGRIELRFESGHEYLTDRDHVLLNASGQMLAAYDGNWVFNKFRASLTSLPNHSAHATVMIFTKPADPSLFHIKAATASQPSPVEEEAAGQHVSSTTLPAPIDLSIYGRQRALCAKRWNALIDAGTQIDVPEPIVNHAWRSLLVGTLGILSGDNLNYSASNQYARKYANECGDSMRSLVLFGHGDIARRTIGPLFTYRRPNIEFHDAGFKLRLLADYYFLTRDASLVEELRPLWQREISLIITSREPQSGLLPREKYCSDIATPVHSLNANANCWRGLRDMSLVLRDVGQKDEADQLASVASAYRKIILRAMDRSTVKTVDPPFIPVAMGGEESPHDPITATRLGSYWNLVIPCVLTSGLFPIDSPPADAIIRTIQEDGGLCMGMTRVQSAPGVWVNTQNIDDLYGLQYSLALLERDEPDRELVSFYGKLAQGMTPDTFIDGESSGIMPLDSRGRQFALPPNSTANASFLIQLRNLLIQDIDSDGNGRADTLRLCFATPRAWLEDGKTIRVLKAPTTFGRLDMVIHADLRHHRVTAAFSLPSSPRTGQMLRLRLPAPWRVTSATADGRSLRLIDADTIDITPLRGIVTMTAIVRK